MSSENLVIINDSIEYCSISIEYCSRAFIVLGTMELNDLEDRTSDLENGGRKAMDTNN